MLTRLKTILKELSLNANDTKVFLACFELGYAPASAIAKQANLNRITAYEALKRLSKRGLVKVRARTGSGVKYFEVEDIGILQQALAEKKESVEHALRDVEKLAIALRTQYAGRTEKPIVLFYDGHHSIQNVLLDTLNQKPKEILSFASADFLITSYDPKFLEQYWRQRTTLKIPSRGIIPKTIEAVRIFTPEKNIRELRRVHFVDPQGYIFKNEIDIYGDNVSIISLVKGSEHGVIIRSRSIAESLRSIFNLIWGATN